MHVDDGIFLAFTPALEAGESRFLVERGDDEQVRVAFHEDALVFMFGFGADKLLKPKMRAGATFTPRAMPHALIVAPSAAGTPPRAWYGRMVREPPGAAVLGDAEGVTYWDRYTSVPAPSDKAFQGYSSIGFGHPSL